LQKTKTGKPRKNIAKILVGKRKKSEIKSPYFLLDAPTFPDFRQKSQTKNAGLPSKIRTVLYGRWRIFGKTPEKGVDVPGKVC